MKSFAILRHGKIKGGRHLVSTGLHNGRGAHTPNADPDAPPVEVLVGSAKPHRDVMSELARRDVAKIRKNGVVAVEMVLTASPEWWQSKGWTPGCHPKGELLALLEEWKAAQLEYLRDRCGDRLVSAIYHGDEASPHIQALAVPVIFRADGREKGELAGRLAWRLDAQVEMGSPGVLKARQTDYADRMARFGLVRGKDIETEEREARGETHKPARVWQQEEGQKDRERDLFLDRLIAKEAAAAEALKRSEAAERDASVLLAQAKVRETETDKAHRNVMAMGVGVEAWMAGDVTPVQKDDGHRVMRWRDEATKERLAPVVKPVFSQLWDWMMAAADRVAEIVKAATLDREEAAKDRAAAARHRDQAEAAQRALEARLSPAAIQRAVDASVTPERLQKAVDDLLTPQLVQDVLLEKVTIARAVNSVLNAQLQAQMRKGQGR